MSQYVRLLLIVALLFPPLVLAAPPLPQRAPFPEQEIQRRREAINQQAKKIELEARQSDAPPGAHPIVVAQATPLSGTLRIDSGSTSTLYGKVRRELNYQIEEHFVGNLITTRYFDPLNKRFADREDFAIQTISTEIIGSKYKGRLCSQYTGSPPACSQWHELDLWQIGEGEEYPGRSEAVVSASTYGQSVTVKMDGPEIFYASSQGEEGLKSGCGDMVQQRVNIEEFKEWRKRRTIHITRELGKTAMGCRPGSTVTLEIQLDK